MLQIHAHVEVLTQATLELEYCTLASGMRIPFRLHLPPLTNHPNRQNNIL